MVKIATQAARRHPKARCPFHRKAGLPTAWNSDTWLIMHSIFEHSSYWSESYSREHRTLYIYTGIRMQGTALVLSPLHIAQDAWLVHCHDCRATTPQTYTVCELPGLHVDHEMPLCELVEDYERRISRTDRRQGRQDAMQPFPRCCTLIRTELCGAGLLSKVQT